MKDSFDNNLIFVKIVERFPVLFDSKMPHRTQVCAVAWEKVAESVRREIKEPCTVDELKNKWKGIRSSFNRFKKRLHLEKNDSSPRQYYLYEALHFLHKHTKPKWEPIDNEEEDNSDNDEEWPKRGIKVERVPVRTYRNNKDPLSVDKKPSLQTLNHNNVPSPVIKIEPLDDDVAGTYAKFEDEATATPEDDKSTLKRNNSSDDAKEATLSLLSKMQKIQDGTDMQFFKSIMPDMSQFSTQEKRKFKMGVLKLIDEIEESRKHQS